MTSKPKMLSYGHDHLPQKSLQIKQDDKFFTKLKSKETSKSEASFRVLYYGGSSGSVPFMWESQPGTPKHPSSLSSLPPLTPPPSYQSNPNPKFMQKRSKPKFIKTFCTRMGSKKNCVTPSISSSSVSSSYSSSSYSYSYSLPSTPVSRGGSCHVRSMSSVRFGSCDDYDYDDDEEEEGTRRPNSTLCLGFREVFSRKFGGKFKNALMSIVGHGKAQRSVH